MSLKGSSLTHSLNTTQYILEYTHHRRVGYVGFSQGSMVGMAAAGLNRKLAKRIGLLVALAATTRPKGIIIK